jgi:hypothetical protein
MVFCAQILQRKAKRSEMLREAPASAAQPTSCCGRHENKGSFCSGRETVPSLRKVSPGGTLSRLHIFYAQSLAAVKRKRVTGTWNMAPVLYPAIVQLLVMK